MHTELLTLSRRLARRKHRLSWFIGLTPCKTLSIWKGMNYGNEWKLDIDQVKALLRNGNRKPV